VREEGLYRTVYRRSQERNSSVENVGVETDGSYEEQ
jgi:hypothetical protein